ncbi:MAG: tetratricopeptide repeat protein [Symploca sp. SIO1C2]|nr:tetratricopeptide repeat protein [Symploca sp. SIO1C2]
MTVEETTSQKISSWNRQTYQRLKLALSLGLRRQLFVAICDDLNLRNRLAKKLQVELGKSSAREFRETQDYPKLVSLDLNLREPHPLRQIAQWLAQHKKSEHPYWQPGFQILGVELLMEQTPEAQRLFLRHLQASERYLLSLESTLLLWLPRPWLYNIQQSVPKFWQWHTGLFEFEGEPTPLPPVGAVKPETSHTPEATHSSHALLSKKKAATVSFQEDLRKLLSDESIELTKKNLPLFPDLSEQQATYLGQTLPWEMFQGKEHTTSIPLPKIPVDVPLPDNTSQELEDLQPEETIDTTQSDELAPQSPTKTGEGKKESADAETRERGEGENGNLTSHLVHPTETADSELPFEEQLSHLKPVTLEVSLVDTYLELGNYYRTLIEQGEASEENLGHAIEAYEQALQWLAGDSDTIPNLVATNTPLSEILNDVGNLYWMLSRSSKAAGDSSESSPTISYLEQSIQSYQSALSKLIAEETPHTYAMIQNNLGAAYGDLARHQEPTANLEESIQAYQEALRYRDEEKDALKYASTQNNLGTAYWNLAQQQSPVTNLQEAIAAYTEALSTYNLESEPLEANSNLNQDQAASPQGVSPLNWAMIQNNLGTAYWNLAQYEQPEAFLDKAIIAYQKALKYRKPEVVPAACAATQNNLATAYWHLADQLPEESEAKVEYLEQSITAYESAIALAQQLQQATPAITVNFELSTTYKNLALAHYQLATQPPFSLTKEARLAHLHAALHQQVQAITAASAESDAYQSALSYIVKTIRAFYRESGTTGQNLALSNIPGSLLPEILPRL